MRMSQLEGESQVDALKLLGLETVIVQGREANESVLVSIERALLIGEDGDS